jgi:hypothetical protein
VKIALGVHTTAAASEPAESAALAPTDAALAMADVAAPRPVGAESADLGSTAGLDSASPAGQTQLPPAPAAPVRRVPIGFDTTNYGVAPDPFRRAAAPEWGWIKVLVINGVGEAVVDGEKVGWAPLLARVAPGKHVVRVSGAGDLFAPSQITANVAPNDTVTAVFAAPSSQPRLPAGETPPDPRAALGDSVPADSVRVAPTADSATSRGPNGR